MSTDDDSAPPASHTPLGSTLTTLDLSESVSNQATSREVIELLDALKDGRSRDKRTWLSQLGVLALSLLVFVSLGLLQWSALEIAILVVVLFVHEGGHYLAMRACGYRDLRMFFIPLFGAAVSGSARNAAGYQRTIVALAGPVPGIVLGLVLAIVHRVSGTSLVGDAAKMFLAINAFNLLPLLPLDGGRVLQETLFCRRAWLEVTFTVVAGLGLIALAAGGGGFFLPALGVVMVMSIQTALRTNRIAKRLRESAAQDEGRRVAAAQVADTSSATSLDFLLRAAHEVEAEFPQTLKPKQIVSLVETVLDKLAPRPPGARATVLLLASYVAAFAIAFAGGVVLFARPAACPPGQVLQVGDVGNGMTARGCVAKSATGDDILEGRWEFFDARGKKVGELRYKHGTAMH